MFGELDVAGHLKVAKTILYQYEAENSVCCVIGRKRMVILDIPTQDIKIMTPKYIFSSTPVCEETRESLDWSLGYCTVSGMFYSYNNGHCLVDQ